MPAGPGTSVKPADGGLPFALTGTGAAGVRLYAINCRAAEEGLATGMTLTDARALVPGLKTRRAGPAADHKALLRLARWCGRYTPWVSCGGVSCGGVSCGEAGNGEDSTITLDISGCGHLFGGEENLLRDLSMRLSAFGITHRLGCAGTLGAAWAIARFGACHDLAKNTFDVVTSGEALEKIKELPVAALRLEEDTVALLGRLGLKTIGSLHGLPRLALMRRFPSRGSGRALGEAVLLRLDQALGKRDEPLSPLTPAPAFRTRMAFAEPLMERTGLAHALNSLLADLTAVLARAGKGARRLSLAAYGADASVSRIAIGTGAPSRDPDHLMFLFRERLERIGLQYGIDLLILNAERVDTLTATQQSMVGGGGAPGGVGDHGDTGAFAGQNTTPLVAPLVAPLIDRLANRLGPANVGRSRPRESHLPERAERRISALTGLSEPPAVSPESPPTVPPANMSDRARPFRLFGRPEPLEVIAEVPEGPPLSFRWRRMNIRVVRAEGPERIAPEWWLDNNSCSAGGCCGDAVRDYYQIEDAEGRRFWVYRDGLYRDAGRNGPPRWYIHGLFA